MDKNVEDRQAFDSQGRPLYGVEYWNRVHQNKVLQRMWAEGKRIKYSDDNEPVRKGVQE